MPFEKVKSHFALAVDDKQGTAEIKMYGNVVTKRPYDFWTGKKSEDDYIIGSEVVEQLEGLKNCKKLNIRLNSLGGDVHTAILIYNRLREMAKNGTEISCSVDGVAMSAGSMIMCAADKVSVTASSLLMIHKSMTLVIDWLNEDQLLKLAKESKEYDKAIAAAYKKKTGKSEKELLDMMAEETYMTGEEAVEKGFADELLEDDKKLEIAACADRSALVINGGYFPLMGLKCPENIPITTSAIMPEGVAINGKTNKTEEVNTVGKDLKEVKSLAEIKAENPELAAAIEAEIKNACQGDVKTATDEAAKKAVEDERKRLAEIDEISALYSEDVVKAAKYGDKACTAAELAYRAAKENAKKGAKFVADLQKDAEASGAQQVDSAELPDEGTPRIKTDKELMAEARAFAKEAFREEQKND